MYQKAKPFNHNETQNEIGNSFGSQIRKPPTSFWKGSLSRNIRIQLASLKK